MARVLLDTTVLIDWLRGQGSTRQRLQALRESGTEAWTSAVNIEELARGMRTSERRATQEFTRGMRIAPLDAATGWLAGEWRREYASQGVTLGQADCLIAAATVGVRARLATGNPKDFPMPALDVEHWPAGE